MRVISTTLRLILLSSLSACATIVSGTSQRVVIDTVPEGAQCGVSQNGMPIGQVSSTPGSVQVQKSSGMVQINCTKAGYQSAQNLQSSGVNGWVFGNILIGGLVGVIVDFASGAAYEYQPDMMLSLQGQVGGPNVAAVPYGYPNSAAPLATASLETDEAQRFEAATGRPIPASHGLIRLPPSSPNGDYTYIWPAHSSE
jgi:hypothetical protein